MRHFKLYLFALIGITLLTQNGLAQQAPDDKIVKTIRDMKEAHCNFLEVSQEMFKLMSADKRAEGQIKEYLSQLNYLIFLQCQPTRDDPSKDLAAQFEKMAQDSKFKLLIKSESRDRRYMFFKRDSGETNEYILAATNQIQYISTTMDITSIREMTHIISIAGEAGGM